MTNEQEAIEILQEIFSDHLWRLNVSRRPGDVWHRGFILLKRIGEESATAAPESSDSSSDSTSD